MDTLQTRLWQEVGVLSVAIATFWAILVWPLLAFDQAVFAGSILAGTSGILLAMSFSLSSFSYYFDFADDKVVYRKQLGLMGYFFALGYTVLTVINNPSLYIAAFPENLLTLEVGFGALAMAILTLMALISNRAAVQWLGGKLWKNILGLGYIAYALLVIRALFLDALLWDEWLATGGATFTVRMFLTVLGILVLLFRASVPFHKKYNKKV